MNDPNLAIIFGRVGKDPESNDKVTVARFSVATSDRWKDEDGEQRQKTQWHTAVAFNEMAKIVQATVKKGSHVYVKGPLTYNEWTDKSGAKRRDAEIIVQDLIVAGNRKEPG